MIPKGEVYEEHKFEKKNPRFREKNFTAEAKEFFTELINYQLPEQMKMKTFPKNGPYLPTKKIGKNNPRAEEIKETNRLKDEWNKGVNRARARGVPKDRLMYVKRELIILPVQRSVKKSDGKKDPVTFRNILARGVKVLLTMLKELEHSDRKTWADAWGDAIEKFMEFCTAKATGMDLNKLKQDKDRSAR